jgi:hypothetical protein
MPIEPSGKLGLAKAATVCMKAIRVGFPGPVTGDKALKIIGFPDQDSINDSLIPNLVTFAAEQKAALDRNSLMLVPDTTFGAMESKVAEAPMKPASQGSN